MPDIVSICRGLEEGKKQKDCFFFDPKAKDSSHCIHNPDGMNICKSLEAQQDRALNN
jgi:hypothetical protein